MTKKGGEKKKCKSKAKRGREKKEEGKKKKKKKKSSPQNRTRVSLMNGHHVLIWADKLAYSVHKPAVQNNTTIADTGSTNLATFKS